MSSSTAVDSQSKVQAAILLRLSEEDRDTIGNMIANSGLADDLLLRQSFCSSIGINRLSSRIPEQPPEQFGRAVVDYIIRNNRISSWDRLGEKLRGIVEGQLLEYLNQIIGRAKQPTPIRVPAPGKRKRLLTPKGSLIPLERIPDNSLRKIEKRLREMNPTKTDVNMVATLYFTGQLEETKKLHEHIKKLKEKLKQNRRENQLTGEPRGLFEDLYDLCAEIENLLEETLQGETLNDRHVFGLNTRNSLSDVMKHTNNVINALDDPSAGLYSAEFNEAMIKVCDTLPRMIVKLEEINAYIQKILKASKLIPDTPHS